MGVLLFGGVSDKIRWPTLASALANVSDGAWTVAVLAKRNRTAAFEALSYLEVDAGNTREAGIGFNNTNEVSIEIDGVSVPETTTTFTSTASPYLFALSKGAGAVAPRIAWKLGSGGAWSHENLGVTLADQVASDVLNIGANDPFGDYFNGWIGVVAWWEGAMSDANKEALDNNWRTSDLYNSAHGTPIFLAQLNVAGASVVDLIGNATSPTATGTTLDAAETLDSWNFDGLGMRLAWIRA